ncbi:hypothetical protein EVI01_17770 [Enterococcus villorum]|uniref:ABC transmembrane type-1 domain-containing protein n=1 Tax=Enterococcus villorum TaxID=112904 RepID=A0A511J364_9ENTE|nr:hypothetical protein EVI01_17770 [Enterococcus villorum]
MLLVGVGRVFIWLKTSDPYRIDQSSRLEGMSWRHWCGTDYLGRDVYTRIVYGTFSSLVITIIVLVSVLTISLLLGGGAGLLGGVFDLLVMTFTDILLSVPSLLLALVFAGIFANTIVTVMIALMISWSGKYIRYIRHLVLDLKKEEFVCLAPLRGSLGKHTLMVHILPNLFTELFSLVISDIGKLLLSISGLSFLGIGIQPPMPELGTILYDGKMYFFVAPWLFIFPGIVLSSIVLLTQAFSHQFSERKE